MAMLSSEVLCRKSVKNLGAGKIVIVKLYLRASEAARLKAQFVSYAIFGKLAILVNLGSVLYITPLLGPWVRSLNLIPASAKSVLTERLDTQIHQHYSR